MPSQEALYDTVWGSGLLGIGLFANVRPQEEGAYMDLALFLTLSESGFFMWDTRVTLGVLQKLLGENMPKSALSPSCPKLRQAV